MTPAGFPHSDIHGSTLESSSPWLFAGFHVLHRLLVPRHPPCALCSLTCMVSLDTGPVNHRLMGRVRGSFRNAEPYFARDSPDRPEGVGHLRLIEERLSTLIDGNCATRLISRLPPLDAELGHETDLALPPVETGEDCAIWRPSGGLVRLFRSKVAVFVSGRGG